MKEIFFVFIACLIFLKNNVARALPSQKIGLTISGGVSLGSYEAGFLYYLVEVSKLNKNFQIPVITGASAGALNALLTAVLKCDPLVSNYEDSLFWKLWIPLNIDKLSRIKSKSAHSLFTKDALQDQIEILREYLQNRPNHKCETHLGIAITRKKPINIKLTNELSAQKSSETVFFTVSQQKKKAGGTAPFSFKNILVSSLKSHYLLLPFNGNFEHDFDLLIKVLAASSSFPGAFETQKVPYCLKTYDRPSSKCTEKDATVDEFIDGGFYDNQPLKSAVILSRHKIGVKNPILLLDPTNYDYPKEDKDDKEEDVFSLFKQISSSMISNARTTMLTQLVEEDPEIVSRIMHSTTKIPLNSYGMNAFLGFFESDFRENDFIYGMYEARRFLIKHFEKSQLKNFPGDKSIRSWKKFFCMSKILDGDSSLSTECQFMYEENYVNSLILLQVSLDRLYRSCKNKDKDSELIFPLNHCLKAQEGGQSPSLLKIEKLLLESDPSLDDFNYFFHLLGIYHFKFRDLGLSREESLHGLQRVHQKLFVLVNDLSSRQSEPYRSLFSVASKPLLDSITTYAPTRSLVYFNFGPSQEIGWSSLIQRKGIIPTPFRFHLAVRTQGVTTLFNKPPQFSLTPLVGLEVEPISWSNSVVQYRLGLQVGRQFGSEDRFGFDSCSMDSLKLNNWACSGWVINPLFVVTFLDRLRIQTAAMMYPFSKLKEGPPFQLTFQVGYQILLD